MTIEGGLIPTKYMITVGGTPNELQPSEIVHFRGYNPENAISGLSPLETLRRVLAEEQAAGKYREEFWQNAARMRGIIERPADAPEWSDTARERFMAEFAALYAGEETGGKTAVLEEGMKFTEGSFNPQESEYLGGRKLTREECARAYHIPLPMVGILEHATFSNITEQHKNLYQDSLGPWLVMIEQDIELQLLPEFADSEDVYVEFNIMDKLAGSFEDQIKSFQAAVGRPWMTPNEARARMNMSSMSGDADELATPLNVIVGGQASPRDSAPPGKSAAQTKARGVDSHFPALRARHAEKWTSVLTSYYKRQERSIVSRVPATVQDGKSVIGGSVWWDDERWNSELGVDLLKLNRVTTLAYAEAMAQKLDAEIEDWDAFEARMLPWLSEHSRIQAESINEHTKTALDEALNEPEALEAVKYVFVMALSAWVGREVVGAITSAASFGSMEAARASRRIEKKTWRVNSGNPRPSHAAMDGETVGIRDNFSNGLRWPGDPQGSADENANCECSVEFS
jgi:HK97 family phage portal protein